MIDATKLDAHFPRADFGAAEMPIWRVNPGTDGIHRFFDTSPISPSGRYLAYFHFPYDDHPQAPGDRGQVMMVDLHTGEEKKVADTAGWEFQMGANINWGATDDALIFNDLDTATWRAFGVKINPHTGAATRLASPVYHVSPDGRYGAVGDLTAMCRTQYGYGVIIPPERVPVYRGLRDDVGVTVIDLTTGKSRLLISTREALERTQTSEKLATFARSDIYCFHTKWSPDSRRLMFTLRHFISRDNAFDIISQPELKYDVFTIRADGSEVFDAIPQEYWRYTGHHTTWTPDSEHLTANIQLAADQRLRFHRVRYDGADFETLGLFTGSGHPSFHKNGKYVITDCYHNELYSTPDGKIPLRLFDFVHRWERHLARIDIFMPSQNRHSYLRLDPHVVWCDEGRWIAFNAVENGRRRVYLADMRQVEGLREP